MNRRRARLGQRRHAAPPRLLSRWTITRATGVGVVSGLAALLMAGVIGTERPSALYLYALLLAATAICGASILWITAFDMRARGTSGRMRVIRGFDAVVGVVLLVPALYALSLVRPELGL